MPPANCIDLTGKPFGRLTVISRAPNRRDWKVHWNCECTCGNTLVVSTSHLRSGHTKSCGCLNNELCSQRAATHKMSKTAEYATWNSMKHRCSNPNNKRFAAYGGRGIKVCDEWRKSFEAFYKYMGPKPHKTDSIDRIDNNGDYRPGNVRWTNAKAQANNRRSSHRITIHGVTKTLAQWADLVGLKQSIISGRIQSGWSPVKAISFKKTNSSRPITVNNVTKTAVEWSKITGIRPRVIYKRLLRKWSPERAVTQPLASK